MALLGLALLLGGCGGLGFAMLWAWLIRVVSALLWDNLLGAWVGAEVGLVLELWLGGRLYFPNFGL